MAFKSPKLMVNDIRMMLATFYRRFGRELFLTIRDASDIMLIFWDHKTCHRQHHKYGFSNTYQLHVDFPLVFIYVVFANCYVYNHP